ncbi:molecular chaperone DnaJ [uncultured bacterium]|nr:molecular chaperone DnaJ [uncultured bacterium]
MNSKRSYYDILGVSKNASKNELDSAFRKLAMKYHPDKYKGADAQDKMKEINKAYKVLSDPNQRKQYDAFLMSGHNTKDFDYQDSTHGFQQEEFGGRDFFSKFSFNFGGNSSYGTDFDFKDIFSSFFGGDSQDNSSDNFMDSEINNKNVSIVIDLTLSEWYNGVTKTISYELNEKCNNCVKQKISCGSCNSKGYIHVAMYGKVVCNNCRGAGYRETLRLCGKCNSGSVKKRITNSFKIPRFMNQKYVIKNSGHFDPKTQSNGNLIINLNILKHSIFKIAENNIIMHLTIGLEEFIYGTRIKFKYIDNNILNLDIYPLSNLELIVPKKGIITNNSNIQGNLIIKINIKNNYSNNINKQDFIKIFNIHPISDSFISR